MPGMAAIIVRRRRPAMEAFRPPVRLPFQMNAVTTRAIVGINHFPLRNAYLICCVQLNPGVGFDGPKYFQKQQDAQQKQQRLEE